MNILSLDGGGSKGMYTLGILHELEATIKEKENKSLAEFFDIIYGTSTGAIIASLIALNKHNISDIKEIYLKIIPAVMGISNRTKRTLALQNYANDIFKAETFDSFKTDIGIVVTNMNTNKPMIFKSSKKYAHSRESTFKKGFDFKISEAVMASCAAYPFFDKYEIQKDIEYTLLDGGFIANNPSLFALIDVMKESSESKINLLSLGVGNYPLPTLGMFDRVKQRFIDKCLTEKILMANANVHEFLVEKIFVNSKNIEIIRINETFSKKEYATNLLETNIDKLKNMFKLGSESYGQKESQIKNTFKL